jgi:hypothetical protein
MTRPAATWTPESDERTGRADGVPDLGNLAPYVAPPRPLPPGWVEIPFRFGDLPSTYRGPSDSFAARRLRGEPVSLEERIPPERRAVLSREAAQRAEIRRRLEAARARTLSRLVGEFS